MEYEAHRKIFDKITSQNVIGNLKYKTEQKFIKVSLDFIPSQTSYDLL